MTDTVAGTMRQPVPPGSVPSVGRIVSIRSVSLRQPESRGSPSTARVLKSNVPEPGIVISVLLASLVIGPLLSCHSIVTGPPSGSLPTSVTSYGAFSQPPGVATVWLVGGTASADAGRPSNAMTAPSSRSDDLRRPIVSP